MLRISTLCRIAALLVVVAGQPAGAEPLTEAEVPEPLRPWISWVLRGHEQERCPALYAARRGKQPQRRPCVWPSRLEIRLEAAGGSFVQDWRVHHEAWALLPGDEAHWPQDVTVDGEIAPVVSSSGHPAVRLEVGDHRVEGRFRWSALPEVIHVPPETGLLALSVAAEEVPFPRRDAEGRVWLQPGARGAPSREDRLELEVVRRVIDDVPLRVVTRIELEVSGRSREELLGRALPEGLLPMRLESPLPARVEPDGRLRVQVRPGTWTLELVGRHRGPVSALAMPDPGGPWAPAEVWAFEAQPELRLVSLEGAPPVDPEQTKLPPDWKRLPAYRMDRTTTLRLVEKRRGDSDPAPDRLDLQRTWWLDFDGRGYTNSDQLTGTVSRSTRLEMGSSTQLGRVSVNERPQLITRIGDSETMGIEVQRGPIELSADSRIEEGHAELPAVSWNHDVQSLSGVLHLPPGWRVVHASGVDRVSSSWITRWTLLDLFVVLVVAMAFARLHGPVWGAVAFVGLALSYTEPAAPRWIWLAVLGAEALARALPEGRFAVWARIARVAALVLLVLIALPFGYAQVRAGLFPGLERPRSAMPWLAADLAMQRAPAPPPHAAKTVFSEEPAAEAEDKEAGIGRYAMDQSRLRKQRYPVTQVPVTTGPGLPSWQWTRVGLHWQGPVRKEQKLRLWLVGPGANGVLAFTRVALLALLLYAVLRRRSGGLAGLSQAVALAAALPLGVVLAAAPARADFPSPELLDELRGRLLEPPACHPQCASHPRMQLEVAPDRLRARLELDVAAETAVPLPGGARDWVPEQVFVDGAPAKALLRTRDGVLWVQVAAGRHRVVLEGRLPDRDSIELPLPLRPHRLEASVAGWSLHGLHEDGLVERNLQLTRIRESADAGPELAPATLPPFVEIRRDIEFGLSWEVTTHVLRRTPADSTIVLEVPLLDGESVTSEGVRVANERALVSMGPGFQRAHWRSVLEERETLRLEAPSDVPWTESWSLTVNPIWHVEFEGIPTTHGQGGGARRWVPWPGEAVTLRVSRPEGIEGPTLTVDSSRLELRPGLRASDATLTLELRSSQGAEHVLTLPEGAVLQGVRIQGREQPIRQEGRHVTLPVTPGRTSVELDWREARGIGLGFVSSGVDLGIASVNTEVHLAVPPNRWTLLVGGPRMGPVVLFWPFVVVLVALAWVLARLPLTPLRWHHWALLLLGLTQVPVWAGALVVGWPLVLGWRKARGCELPGRWFDLLQVALAGWTLLAAVALIVSLHQGLLGLPEMQVAGNGSSSELLRWYLDRSAGLLPQPWVFSVPLLVYRGVMLAWALWLAVALTRWTRWGWACFSDGELWRGRRPPPPPPVQEPIDVPG
jgi:hypothetical protein